MSVTIHTVPYLNPIQLEIWYMYDPVGVYQNIFLGIFPHPPYGGPYYIPPETLLPSPYVYQVRFPAQQVGGVWYGYAETAMFGIVTDRVYTLNLVSEEAVPTALTIQTAPSAAPGEPFTVSGVLSRVDTGEPVQGEEVSLGYDGVSVGSMFTDGVGGYSFAVQIPVAGSYVLTASFGGVSASVGVRIGEPGLGGLLPLAVVVGGLYLASRSR